MDIFVGNLSFDATEGDVRKLFEGFGNVASVVIVMRKEKRVPKSRGFGFIQMPDEQQALAAIAALNGKEFMGRVLNVDPARPKTEARAEHKLEEQRQPKALVEARQHPQEEREQKKTWFSPVFKKHLAFPDHNVRNESGSRQRLLYGREKDGQVRPAGRHLALKDGQVRPSGRPGTYKSGRRTHSYMKLQGLTGMPVEAKPRKSSQDNPMRWRKRKDQAKPWQKGSGEHKPWQKTEGEARPWKKAEGEFKPWRKSEGGVKPWKKPAGEAKPWSKSNGRPQKSRFNPSASPGMVRGNGEHSRTKGRRKSGGYKR
jgi:hypothetical protein